MDDMTIRAVTSAALVPIVVIVIVAQAASGNQALITPGARYVAGEILVRFRPAASLLDQAQIRAARLARATFTFASGAEQWILAPSDTVEAAVEELSANDLVEYAEPNYLLDLYETIPIDPNFPEQWALRNTGQMSGCTPGADIKATFAWDIVTGSSSVVVAITDTGVVYTHPDLAANIWANPQEVPFNPVDEDGCGYLNDVRGYDWADNDTDPLEELGQPGQQPHGTKVAGIAGAVGNNEVCTTTGGEPDCRGTAGVNWSVKLMPLRIFPAGGAEAAVANAVKAIEYATCMKADIINASWGGLGESQTLRNAIQTAANREIVFIEAAGNLSLDLDLNPRFPQSYGLENMIVVAATTCSDALGPGSNFGAATVHLGAPGLAILSPSRFHPQTGVPLWELANGTSFAAPHVAGATALLRALSPKMPVALLKPRLLDHVDAVGSLAGITVTGGRLNAHGPVQNQDMVPPTSISNLATGVSGGTTMPLSWTATGDDGTSGTAALYQVRYAVEPVTEMNFYLATKATGVPTPATPGSLESLVVTGLAPGTCYHFAVKAFDEWGNGPISNVRKCGTRPPFCQVEYCRLVGEDIVQRCTWTNTYGSCRCCEYTCVEDEACQPEAPPTHACGNYCL